MSAIRTRTKSDPTPIGLTRERAVTRKLLGRLRLIARAYGTTFTAKQADRLVALKLRYDAAVAEPKLETFDMPATLRSGIRRGTTTTLGVIELPAPGDGRFLVLLRGNQAWLVPDMPDGWERREPWFGDITSVRWVGGAPAVAAFMRVGAPI